MSPLDECCTTCECGRVYCRDNYSACPDCPPPPATRCGRLDEHDPHPWGLHAGHACTGKVLIEGGYDGDAA